MRSTCPGPCSRCGEVRELRSFDELCGHCGHGVDRYRLLDAAQDERRKSAHAFETFLDLPQLTEVGP